MAARRLRKGYVTLGRASTYLGVPRRTLSRWMLNYAIHCDEAVRGENGEALDLWWDRGAYTVRMDGLRLWRKSREICEEWLYGKRVEA